MKNLHKVIKNAEILEGRRERFVYVTYENGVKDIIGPVAKGIAIYGTMFTRLTKSAALEILRKKMFEYSKNLLMD